MRASSSTRLETLGSEQAALLEEHRRTWSTLRLATGPSDRKLVETAVSLAYEAAGLDAPRSIVWCAGPLEMARTWHTHRDTEGVGHSVREAVVERQHDRAERLISEAIGPMVRRSLAGMARTPADAAASEATQVVVRLAGGVRPSLATMLKRIAASTFASRAAPSRRMSLTRASVSAFELDWTWACWALNECLEAMPAEVEKLRGLWLISTEGCWLLPFAGTCWVSERPTALAHDDRGRLHNAKGPALAFGDGLAHYAWKGVEMRPELIEAPAAITLDAIDREPDPIVRRSMIEIITPKRFIEAGGAIRVSEDETGTLWRKTWMIGDSWAAVEVVNGTVEADGTRQRYFLQVPPDMRTARAAVAWTYGMAESQYRRLTMRT